MKKVRVQYDLSIVKSEVKFSHDGNHRYLLKRVWDDNLPMAGAIMLNPTDADALFSDKTLMKLMNYFIENKYGGFYVVNLFSYVANSENELLRETIYDERYNDKTDRWISKAIEGSKDFYIAWGSNKNRKIRIKRLVKILKDLKKKSVFKLENENGDITHLSRSHNGFQWVRIKVEDILR